jgi:hypothetical protein
VRDPVIIIRLPSTTISASMTTLRSTQSRLSNIAGHRKIIAFREVVGLHHRYERRAA